MMTRKLLLLTSLLCVLGLTTACESKSNSNSGVDNPSSEETSSSSNRETPPPVPKTSGNKITDGQVIASDDGLSEITVPKSWQTETELNASANIQVSDTEDTNYLIILSDPKEDVDQSMTLADHSNATREIFFEGLTDLEIIEEGTELTINGRPALQYVFKGTISSGLAVTYIHTTVDGNQAFHQILGWTLPSKFNQNRSTLEAVINSFQEI